MEPRKPEGGRELHKHKMPAALCQGLEKAGSLTQQRRRLCSSMGLAQKCSKHQGLPEAAEMVEKLLDLYWEWMNVKDIWSFLKCVVTSLPLPSPHKCSQVFKLQVYVLACFHNGNTVLKEFLTQKLRKYPWKQIISLFFVKQWTWVNKTKAPKGAFRLMIIIIREGDLETQLYL